MNESIDRDRIYVREEADGSVETYVYDKSGVAFSERDGPYDAPPEGFDAVAFAATAPWRFASTMSWCPHWYTVRGQTDDAAFDAMVLTVRTRGFWGLWATNHRHYYFDCGEYRYWTMGWPVDETIVINREPIGKSKVVPLGG